MKKGALVLLLVSTLLVACGKDDNRVCLSSHIETTPAGVYYEPRMNTGPGSSIGFDGSVGLGGGTTGGISYGPVYKNENNVTVCDVYGTPEG